MYSKKQLFYLDDNELMSILKEEWNFSHGESIEVIGELSIAFQIDGINHYKIFNVKHLKDFTSLEYPLDDLAPNNSIVSEGVYVPLGIDKNLKQQLKSYQSLNVICSLVLSHEEERQKQDNPILVQAVAKTVKPYVHIDSSLITRDENGRIIINQSIINTIRHEYAKELEDSFRKTKDNYEKEEGNLKKSIQKLESKRNTISHEYDKELEASLKKIKDIYEKEESNFKKSIKKLENKENKLQKSINNLTENKNKIEKDIESKSLTLQDFKNQLSKIEDDMSKKLEKLQEFIKVKADQLLRLEFIDEEEYNNILMVEKNQQQDDTKYLSFEKDLGSDKQSAISHIQAYLFNDGIIYPKYILEDFFALVQTNDLIILAGESGSGKTNLVKSFADAIGGKSSIIPVKPNWTSSEDLLGYYNPLENKYQSTPFLEVLIEAQNNPETPYFICLDEMNLARVEYYFADFLSILEERNNSPKINLYSEDETAHTLSEFKNVLELIDKTKEKYQKKNITNFVKLLQDEEINQELTRVFGFSDKDSLIKYHTDLRRMIIGKINIPPEITFPKNVKIIGAINIDETTHYLSPKILDRAHIMKFDSPLLFDWIKIDHEIEEVENKNLRIKFSIEDLGKRKPYPSFDKDDQFCKTIVDLTKKYLNPLEVEVGLRTIRQGLNYKNILIEQGSSEELIMNNFILHKILPKLTFDGGKKIFIEGEGEKQKIDILKNFMHELKNLINENSIENGRHNAINELNRIIKKSENNNEIVNYWA